MRDSLHSLALTLIAGLAASFPTLAQTAATPPGAGVGKNLSGIWLLAGGMNEWETGGRRFSPLEPPLRPWALQRYKANRAGLPEDYDGALDDRDPNTYCFPPGLSRSLLMPYPFEVVQRPDQLYILFEYGSGIRRIYTDGRPRPPDLPLTWMGYSIGEWDGETLVVETDSLRPETWLDRIGTPHSDALRIQERFRRGNSATLEIEFLFEDAKAFTRPWGGRKLFEPHFEITEYILCEEFLEMGKVRGAN